MKYVLDASVAVRNALPTAVTPKAQRLLDDYALHVHALIAPSTYPAEVASALTKGERAKTIQFGEARKFLFDLLQNPPVLHDYFPLLLLRYGHFIAVSSRAARLSLRRPCRTRGV